MDSILEGCDVDGALFALRRRVSYALLPALAAYWLTRLDGCVKKARSCFPSCQKKETKKSSDCKFNVRGGTAALPGAVATGLGDREDIGKERGAGPMGYVTKPLDVPRSWPESKPDLIIGAAYGS